MLQSIAKDHWHVPTAVVAFQKWLLENRGLPTTLNLDRWKGMIQEQDELSADEQHVLQSLILRIDPQQTVFSVEVLFSLTDQIFIQYDQNRYVLFKYLTGITYDDAWNSFYLLARGCVIDVEEMDVVTATLPKFFNMDEKVYTSYSIISKKAQIGNVTRYIKQDGSCVSLSYRHDLLITTPGAFDSEQALLARDFLTTHQQTFLTDVKEKYTQYSFIFEYVGPENEIIVTYPETDMILLHIIDTRTGAILSYEQVKEIGDTYGLTVCEVVDLSLETIMQDRYNKDLYTAQKQEGWIIRIDTGEETVMVKVKCADYVQLHRIIFNALNPKFLLESLQNETFDDVFAQLRSDRVRKIVLQIKDLIMAWDRGHRETFQEWVETIPSKEWGTEELTQRFQQYERFIADATRGMSKEDRIRRFLYAFAKGKTTDPKEEVLLKAKRLYAMNYDFSLLTHYDAYKAFIDKRIREFIKELRQSISDYVFKGSVHPVYETWLHAHFSDEYHITEGIADIEDWENVFSANKEQYLRICMTKKEKLTPQYHVIYDYCVRKYAYETKIEPLLSALRKEMLFYLLQDESSASSIVMDYVKPDWIINESLRAFHMFKETFENETVPSQFPEEDTQTINGIIREFYFLLRGLETDTSYEVAQSIFATIPKNLQQHQLYFKERGVFSGYVNRHIPSFYRNYFFKLYERRAVDRVAFLREMTFLPEANAIVNDSKAELSEEDIDFRSLRDILTELSNQDS